MNRRSFLRTAGVAGAAALAGCGGLFETRSIRSPPLVEDRPNAVYYPSHVEGMAMVGTKTAGRYACALTFSFPHRFWLVTGTKRRKVSVGSSDSVHLMASVWETKTRTPLVGSSVSVRIERDGDVVAAKPPWPMLSQNMGVHFGDNYALPGEGAYDVTVDLEPASVRRTGSLDGSFGGVRTVSFDFSFSRSELRDLSFRRLEKKRGKRGAVEPMGTGRAPTTRLAPAGDLPGQVLGETRSGDAVFVLTRLEEPPVGIDGAGEYLAVSARTPYNRYPLPMVSLEAGVDRGGTTVFDGNLTPTLDPELGYHYGATLDAIESGDVVTIVPGVPPQVARHEGYETAFFGLSETSIRL